jgi:hypothetical protein
MTKDEKSLLLYLETRVVDHNGLIDGRNMNEGDFEIAKGWAEAGFIKFGRLTMAELQCIVGTKPMEHRTHFVRLSPDAWKKAHEERVARSKSWITAWEKQYFVPEKLG